MIAAITLFVVLFLTVLVNRVATIAISHTGLSRESARFQARSALTGAGFTTNESEKVVDHPVRRRIILALMLIGNAGIVTAISSLILTFVVPNSTQSLIISVVVLVLGIAFLWWAAQSEMVDRYISKLINKALKKYSSINVRDYAAILHLAGEFQVTELQVNKNDWVANKTLEEAKLTHEGVMVLGIKRKDGSYIGTPEGSTKILPKDVLTVYGKASNFKALDIRKKGWQGDAQHKESVAEHKKTKGKNP